ncbi:MAG: hypothetical protein EP312_11140 [Gammaproteobacteria bacterium]|nr:MAG: hypothetical protein EP312_11140 [Gammaproteobacteria bacterium]
MENRQPTPGLVSITWIIYGLHAFSAFSGVASPALVVTAFLAGWPSIIALILSYVKRGDARGTYLESHMNWLIRTFWFALLWLVLAAVLAATFVGIPMAITLAWLTGIWVLYRIIRGALCLFDDKAIDVAMTPPAGSPPPASGA